MPQNGVLEALRTEVARSRAMRFDSLPENARATAHHSLLDWLGCAVAGSREESAAQTAAALSPQSGPSSVIGSADRIGWRDAIMLNGVHGHALDFDDMLPEFQGHPSAAIFPALWVLGEERSSTITEILEAYVAGVEIGVWIARQVMPEHYDAGWHGTATMGVFAAAAAVAKLLDLDEDQWIAALDFAATQSAGIRSLFGTPGKPLHAGKASEAGALSARLAQAGAVSRGQGLTAERGYFSLYGAGKTAPAESAGYEWAVAGTLYKTYASCFMTQSVVDTAIELSAELGDDEIESIEVTVSPKLRDVCAIEDPTTGNEAKFSVHATTALGLLGHDLSTEDTYSPEVLAEPAYRALRERITLVFDPALSGIETQSRTRVQLASGTVLTAERDRGVPESDLAARLQATARKVTALVAPVYGPGAAARLIEMLETPSNIINQLSDALTVASKPQKD